MITVRFVLVSYILLFVIIVLKGCHADPQKFKAVIVEAFPKLRQGGGFELLKISGNTRSRYVSLIPCPNEGNHVKYLKDPQNQIGHATIFIRPLHPKKKKSKIHGRLFI